MDKELLRLNRIKTVEALYEVDMNCLEPAYLENEFVGKIVSYYQDNKEDIDNLIEKSLTNYHLNRLSYVTRAIVRMATIEFILGTPVPVVINEALEIAKVYSDSGDNKDVKFINRLLDTISKNL